MNADTTNFIREAQLGSTQGRMWALGTDPAKSWLGPKFSCTLVTLWSTDSQKKIVNVTPPDVRF